MIDDTKAVFQAFAAYSQAFNALDPNSVAPYIHLPALLVTVDAVIPISNDAEVKGTFKQFFEKLEQGNFKESKLHSLQINQVSQNQAIVSGTATRYKTDGSVLEHFGLTYTLRKVDKDWKIVAGVLHDPTEFSATIPFSPK
jgi:hypothetical protein